MICDDGTVACGACGSLVEDATDLVRGLRADVENLERELRAKRRRIRDLQGEQDSSLRSSPHWPAVMRILGRWKERCAPDARELTGNHRPERVIARLKPKDGFTEAECMEAIEGYARFPFVVDGERSSAGRTDQWFADAELVFRTPGHVKRGIAMARRELHLPPGALEAVPWRRVQEANRRLIVRGLREEFGTAGLELEDGHLSLPCPRCVEAGAAESLADATWLRVAPAGGSWLASCYACGLGEGALLRRYGGSPDPVRDASAAPTQMSLEAA